MSIIDWSAILPSTASVTFSSLAIPDSRDSFTRDVAEIRLPRNLVIDVEWCEDDRKYFVTLFREDYDDIIVQVPCDSPSEVVEMVKTLAEQHSEGSILTSSSYETIECEYA